MESESLNKLIELYGSKAKAARALGVRRSRLTYWFDNGYIPLRNAPLVERKTCGRISYAQMYRDWLDRQLEKDAA